MGDPRNRPHQRHARDPSRVCNKLKVTNPEDDAEGFKELRAAYEFALQYSARSASNEVELPAPTSPGAEPAPFEVFEGLMVTPVHVPPALDLDRDLLAQQAAITEIAEVLRGRKPIEDARVERLLAAVLDSTRLERFDLYQRTELELGQLLVRHMPRSDPFLAAVEEKFEWSKRQNDRNLPPLRVPSSAGSAICGTSRTCREAMTRRAAHSRVSVCRRGQSSAGDMHFLTLRGEWAELELLDKLEADHPELQSMLRPENVAWWRKFESRPRFSMSTLLFGLIVSFIAILAVFPAPRSDATYWLIPLGAIAVALFRYIAVDWPVHLAQERWYGVPPTWLALGWLPASIALLFAAALVQDFPWFSWSIAVLAGLTSMWALVVGGPALPVISSHGLAFANSRLSRIAMINFLALIWLTAAVSDAPAAFSWPLLMTIVAAMSASAVGRRQQIRLFAGLSVRARMLFCLVCCALAFLLAFATIRLGMRPGWPAVLFVTVLSLMLLRRAAPMDLQLPQLNWNVYWVGGIVAVNLVRVLSDVDFNSGVAVPTGDGTLLVATIVMLVGVIAATLQYAYLLHRSQRP